MFKVDEKLALDVFYNGESSCLNSIIDCKTYHFVRPILRIINAVSSPYSHFDFYEKMIAQTLFSKKNPNILISGTADYSWIIKNSPLLKAINKFNIKNTKIKIIDACMTPLIFSLKASEYLNNIAVSFEALDIPHQTLNNQKYDMIITDAFLTQFSSKIERLKILKSWREMLSDTGVVITTAQISSGLSTRNSHTTNKFVKNTMQLFDSSVFPDLLNINRNEFEKNVLEYATPTKSRVYESEEELVNEILISDLKIKNIYNKKIYSESSKKTLEYRELVLSIK